jgi:ligand-binding sensor domain-containing protein
MVSSPATHNLSAIKWWSAANLREIPRVLISRNVKFFSAFKTDGVHHFWLESDGTSTALWTTQDIACVRLATEPLMLNVTATASTGYFVNYGAASKYEGTIKRVRS